MKQTSCLTALLCAAALAACGSESQTPAAASATPEARTAAASAASVPQQEAPAHPASAASASASQEDPAFKADALALLKQIEEIGTQSSAYLDSEEMRKKVEEIKTSKDTARKNSLSVEIYRSNIKAYQDAVAKLDTFKANDKEVLALRDLWIKKFQTDIKLFEIQIKEIDSGLSDDQIQEKYKDLYRQNREMAQDAAEQNMAFYKRTR
ncbi:Uncharacterised protein [Kingella potus]|uniref:Lipoprotein n=1 Tax=Kingella potus TaxID=265175 RepID=A0A377R145_9NEIS|nr:hypothetical protein [Kingella potus]STR00987.1 Uncharacterised protein [Kingella potus]